MKSQYSNADFFNSEEEKRLYQDLVETSQDLIWQCDAEGRYIFLNPAWETVFGYKVEEMLGKRFSDFQTPDVAERDNQEFIRLIQGGMVKGLETIHIGKAGNKIHLIFNAKSVKDKEGNIIGTRGTAHDITERKKAEDELIETTARFRGIFDKSPVGIVILDVNQKFVKCNPAFCHLMGYSEQEFLERSFTDIVFSDDISVGQQEITMMRNRELDITSFRIRLINQEKAIIWGEINLSRVEDTGPQPLQFLLVIKDITEQKKYEMELAESRNRLELATESAKLGIWDWDVIQNSMIWDDQMYALYGVKDRSSISGIDLWKRGLHPEDAEYAWNECLAALKGEKKYDIEFRVVHPDGKIIYIKADGLVLRDESGQAVRMLGVNRDITREKISEQELQKSEEKFRLLYTSMDQGLALHEIILDENGKPDDYIFLDLNDSYTRLVGITREMAIGKRVKEIFPQVEQYWIDVFGQVALTGQSCYYENYMETLDKYYSTYSYCPRKNQFAVLVTDITDRKQAEKTVAEEKERLAVTLRSIGDGVITTDIKGNIVIMNKVAEQLCGWEQEQALGKPITEVFNIINESTREPHINPVEKVLNTGEIIELANHTLLISRDGTERIIADSGAPIKDKDSITIGVVLVFRDMTEKQKLMEKTQNVQKLESLGVLAGGIAHDFNNLMGGLFGYIDLALAVSQNQEVSDYLSKAMLALDRARALTSQLLTFAKGGSPIQKVTVLPPFIQETVRFALSGSHVKCSFDIPEDLWYANVDQNQIGQVIDNIIINAQQAMPNGGIVQVSARNITIHKIGSVVLVPGDYVCLSIKDQGIGIPAEIIPHIFDPFYTTKSKGHGLGLATCYSIINRHGGYIDVKSQPGQGSTFTIYLPAEHKQIPEVKMQSPESIQGSGTIIVMDDEEMICNLSATILQKFGFKVLCAKNGEEAIDIFQQQIKSGNTISGLILDLTIPGALGGKETVKEIRKVDTKIPVFVSSGYADDTIMKNPEEFGFTASISKPFRIQELSELLKKYLI